jgi:Tfp pilus assembly PilM family ATPase
MARSVGIELTDASVRILSLETSGKKSRILQFFKAPIPAEGSSAWEERATAVLREALAASKVPRGRVVAAVDSGDALLREVTLPFKGDDQIRRTVRFEMESLIHNYSIEQLVVAHYKTGETDKGSHLLAAAIPKEALARRLKVFQDAGVDPVAIDLDVCAVFNAFLHAGAIDSDAPHLLIHGTSKFTKLVFVEGRQPRSIRTIRFSLPAEAAVAAAPAAGPRPPDRDDEPAPVVILSEEEAKRFGDLDQDTQGALVEILAKEISRFLLASAASASPSHILLSGDFEDEEAARMLETATEIPVRTFNLLGAVEHSFGPSADERSYRLAAPLGLALKGSGVDALGMDFRQDEFQYRKKFEALKTTLLVTVELVVVFLAAVALHLYFKRTELRRDTKYVVEQQAELHDRVTGQTTVDPLEAYPKFKRLAEQAGTAPGGQFPMVASGRAAWIDLFTAIQRFQQKNAHQRLGDGDLFLEIETVEVQQGTTAGNENLMVRMRGKIRNHEFAGALRNEIRTMETLANADWEGPITPLDSGLFQFTLKATKKKGAL